MFQFIEDIFSFFLKNSNGVSIDDIRIATLLQTLCCCALFTFLIFAIFNAVSYLKRIAIALEQQNIIIGNSKSNNYTNVTSNQPKTTSEIPLNPNEIVGPNNVTPPMKKKNVFTTDLGDLFKK